MVSVPRKGVNFWPSANGFRQFSSKLRGALPRTFFNLPHRC